MVSLNELKKRYGVESIAPYGLVVKVPGSEFNPDWEAELDVDVIQTDFGDPRNPYTLIPIKTAEPKEEPRPLAKSPAKKKRGWNLGVREWPPEECERLMKRWDMVSGTAAQRGEKLAPEFPGRTSSSIWQKHWALLARAKKKKAENTKDSERKIEEKPEKKSEEPAHAEPVVKPRLVRMDLAEALAALVEAVGPENVQFNVSIQIGTVPPKPT